ncbi:MAG: hypothetical protein GEV13_00360 [Rhodospirillales bacterium]|nr:hypothetical protein [Rhodospirillales bacterium]
MSRSEDTPLSANEEITLRRVAHGQSDVTRLRVEDLVRLRSLVLVTGTTRAPVLTAAGKARFDRLAKPAAVTEFNAQNELMATLGRLMARKAQR